MRHQATCLPTLLLTIYSVFDCLVIAATYKAATFLDERVSPEHIQLPHPYLYTFGRFAVWALYSFFAGLFGTGIWVIGHECGHQAFSESKLINNVAGWFIHSACVLSVTKPALPPVLTGVAGFLFSFFDMVC